VQSELIALPWVVEQALRNVVVCDRSSKRAWLPRVVERAAPRVGEDAFGDRHSLHADRLAAGQAVDHRLDRVFGVEDGAAVGDDLQPLTCHSLE